MTRQWHCYVGGQRYGPVSDDVLREWAASGRLRPADNVWTEGMSDWAAAVTVGGLFASSISAAAPTSFAYTRPHRGGMVLTFGIIGIAGHLFCGIVALAFGIIAWVMGASDLREMAEGKMDRSGEGATRAGMICGIIGVVIVLIGIVAIVALIIADA